MKQLTETDKIKCQECSWRGKKNEMLTAPNPFDPEDSVTGCPECLCVDTLEPVCDEPKCWVAVSCGTPTENGYRNTCGEHAP